jgi:hypothetical protein
MPPMPTLNERLKAYGCEDILLRGNSSPIKGRFDIIYFKGEARCRNTQQETNELVRETWEEASARQSVVVCWR